MSNIAKAFAGGKAFIPFITCGDPSLEETKKIVRAAAANGADLIELGIPFSDPTAEGVVIMDADKRALDGGATTESIFAMVEELRQEITIPMVFMTYANVLFSYGIDQFGARCARAGIDGVILPDVPFEEKHEFSDILDKYGVDLLSMIAPTSEDRIARIASEAKGFLYCVSSLGVTGTREAITSDVAGMIQVAKKFTSVPCAVGFGISTPAQAAEMAAVSDGAIVGSAIVRMCENYQPDVPEKIGAFIKSMKEAVAKV